MSCELQGKSKTFADIISAKNTLKAKEYFPHTFTQIRSREKTCCCDAVCPGDVGGDEDAEEPEGVDPSPHTQHSIDACAGGGGWGGRDVQS